MSWISIDDDLPDNNTLCWAYIPNKGIILRLYFKNDGFGLGDDDMQVAYWMPFRRAVNDYCIVLPTDGQIVRKHLFQ
jgi:hypothetical protein